MKTKEKILIFFTFLFTSLAQALLNGSHVSQNWIVSGAKRPTNSKSEGTINFGLFRGIRKLNHGFGERVYEMDVVETQYREKQFMVRELYVTTIACVCVSALFGIICAVLSLLNTSCNPSEPVCHYPGMLRIFGSTRPTHGSDHYFHTWCLHVRPFVLPYVRPHFSKSRKTKQTQSVIAIVGLAEWIIDDTQCLVDPEADHSPGR